MLVCWLFFFFKQKTAYEMRISDWSSDVCSSDLGNIEAGGLRIDVAAHRVFAGEDPIQIGPTEYRLLHFFMTHPERVYSRSQLLDNVWGGNGYVEERTVDVHIRRLRKTLEPHGVDADRKSTRRNSSHYCAPRMPSYA